MKHLKNNSNIADPHQPCVLIHARIEASAEWSGRLRVYVLLAPHLQVGGWGNSAQQIQLMGKDILLAWKDSTHLAMDVDVGFVKTSCGYVGASDGWQDLRDNFQMDWQFSRIEDGNIALIGQIDLTKHKQFTLGLSFGDTRHAAVSALAQSLSAPFAEHRTRYIEQWRRVCSGVANLDKFSGDGGRLYRISHGLLLAHEDKTFAGAFIASASIPWGEARGDEDLGGYNWSGIAIWSTAPRGFWLVTIQLLHSGRSSISLAHSARTAVSPKTSGSMAHLTGVASSSMRSLFL